MAKDKSTPAQHRTEQFCREYMIDKNATRAATAAGYSAKTAAQQGSRLLKNVKIQARIDQLLSEAAARNDVTVDRVLQELGRIAFFDARKLFMDDGTAKPITELDDDTAAALAGVEVAEIFMGTGPERTVIGYTKKYKVVDKSASLANAMRMLGLFKADNEQHANPLKEMMELMHASRGRKGLI